MAAIDKTYIDGKEYPIYRQWWIDNYDKMVKELNKKIFNNVLQQTSKNNNILSQQKYIGNISEINTQIVDTDVRNSDIEQYNDTIYIIYSKYIKFTQNQVDNQ